MRERVADYLRVSTTTVRQWTKKAILPFYRPVGSGRRLFSSGHIRAFLARCEQGGYP